MKELIVIILIIGAVLGAYYFVNKALPNQNNGLVSDQRTLDNFQQLQKANAKTSTGMNDGMVHSSGMDAPSVTGGRTYTLLLLAENDSNQSGEANFIEMGNKTKVAITIKNPTQLAQPAHIHSGFCPKVGEIKYPLSNLVGGKSETVINVNFDQLKQQLPLGLNVHKSDAEMKTSVACGDLFGE
jgi:hypothetical protein